MKRHFIFLFLLISGLIWISDPVMGSPRNYSYRSAGTAGLFKAEYDRISDNPAYVGAALNFLDYSNSPTKEKTNLFTTMDGLNTDGRFLMGGIGKVGPVGIGGYTELGYQKSPLNSNLNTTVGNTTVNLTFTGLDYDGTAEGSDVYLTSGADSIYDNKETLLVNEDNYNTDNHLNARIAIGGLNVGPIIIGASFERNTDNNFGITGDPGTGETVDEGGWGWTNERIMDGFIVSNQTASFENKTILEPYNYLTKVGVVILLGGVLEAIEAEASYNILKFEKEENNNGSMSATTTGSNTVISSGNLVDTDRVVSDIEKRDGAQYGLKVQTRERIMGWSASTYVSWIFGGLTPNKERETIYGQTANNYSTIYYGNPDRINSRSETGAFSYEGDGITINQYEAGINLRKQLTENILFGFGFLFNLYISENKYNKTTIYSSIRQLNDGDLTPEAYNGTGINEDYTSSTTGIYTDKYKDSVNTKTFTIPIGLEYQATSSLCWRLGIIHVTTLGATESKWERALVSDLFMDVDDEFTAGNETGNDQLVNPTTSAGATIGAGTNGYNFRTEPRGDREHNKNYQQANYYYVGAGYTLDETVQLDILWYSWAANSFRPDAQYWYMSATYIIK